MVATVSTSYYEPFNVARPFASIDHRAAAALAGMSSRRIMMRPAITQPEGLDPHALRYERGNEIRGCRVRSGDSFE